MCFVCIALWPKPPTAEAYPKKMRAPKKARAWLQKQLRFCFRKISVPPASNRDGEACSESIVECQPPEYEEKQPERATVVPTIAGEVGYQRNQKHGAGKGALGAL